MRGSAVLAIRRFVLYLLWTGLCIPVQMLFLALRLPTRATFPRLYHRICMRFLGIHVVVRGRPAAHRPILFVSNHSSYFDVAILGSVVDVSFVAKSEVAGWPLFGLLAKLQRTVFVDRRVTNTGRDRQSIEDRLRAGDNLVLFPEGTSSDGNHTLPFKSALFAVAGLEVGAEPLAVQPVSIACTALDGIPLGRRHRWVYAWYGDMALAPHLWSLVGLGDLTVVVEFHAPVTMAQFGSRKALAEHCWRDVATGVAAANAGYPAPARA